MNNEKSATSSANTKENTAGTKTAKKLTFEKAMARLDEIVSAMESGDAELEKSLELFEEGVELVRFCTGALDKAEQKVITLTASETER